MPRVYPIRTLLAQRVRERRLTFEELSERLGVSRDATGPAQSDQQNRLSRSCWPRRKADHTERPSRLHGNRARTMVSQ
jgi:hypothetical protein